MNIFQQGRIAACGDIFYPAALRPPHFFTIHSSLFLPLQGERQTPPPPAGAPPLLGEAWASPAPTALHQTAGDVVGATLEVARKKAPLVRGGLK